MKEMLLNYVNSEKKPVRYSEDPCGRYQNQCA